MEGHATKERDDYEKERDDYEKCVLTLNITEEVFSQVFFSSKVSKRC